MDTQGRDVQDVLAEKIEKSIANLKENLNTVRAGRANPALLDKVMVDYYGTPTPLKSIANIAAPDPRSLLVTPFDPKSLHEVEKAINVANIGINPSNDGKVIRLQIPALTEERRKELTKLVKKYGEDAKVAIRNERRDANEILKKQEKAGELTEDDLKDEEKKTQKKADDATAEIDKIVAAKDAEILEV
ncbi:MAG: ribosome recycling factor [Clostridiales Family XIII bacterium]|jgi:ribosome recycling factor|nr:ribosome recycling factor [Clostridiales Family XIII bacterium]